MIDQEKRKAVYCLFQEGKTIKEISFALNISAKSVRRIIEQKGEICENARSDKIVVPEDLLRRLYEACDGYVERVHEKLLEEEGIEVGYSTLTRLIRELGIGKDKKERSGREPDKPGDEMQHDTTVYKVRFGETRVRVVASILYLRYCKQRYLKFYRTFNRFTMKCFLHEALQYYGYAAGTCIIDNTNLARLRGTGKNAVIVPEMINFAGQYGFTFVCHAIGHANRKAGNERSFFTVETNFLPGRCFETLEDMNRQALEWATVRVANRPVRGCGLIPSEAFEYEKPYLKKLSPHIPAPYRIVERGIDQYGYAAYNGNYYWVPEKVEPPLKLLIYSDTLKIYRHRKLLVEYTLPPDGVKNKAFSPPGKPGPRQKPKYRKRPTEMEEQKLRESGPEVREYLDFVGKELGRERHSLIRGLFALSRKLAPAILIKTLHRALKYRITDIRIIENIVRLQISDGYDKIPQVDYDSEFKDRENYQEGRLSDNPDLKAYDRLLEDTSDGQDDDGTTEVPETH